MTQNKRQNLEQAGASEENVENRRKRLIFRSNHRGTKEMDLILGSFALKNVPDFSVQELSDYDTLLCENDPDLYNWITEKENAPEDIAQMTVFQKLQAHKYA